MYKISINKKSLIDKKFKFISGETKKNDNETKNGSIINTVIKETMCFLGFVILHIITCKIKTIKNSIKE